MRRSISTPHLVGADHHAAHAGCAVQWRDGHERNDGGAVGIGDDAAHPCLTPNPWTLDPNPDPTHLVGADDHAAHTGCAVQRRDGHERDDGGAVGVGDDAALSCAVPIQGVRVDLRNYQGNAVGHAERRAVVDHLPRQDRRQGRANRRSLDCWDGCHPAKRFLLRDRAGRARLDVCW